MTKQHSSDVVWHPHQVSKTARAHAKGLNKSAVLWFTGLSGSGKSTIANALEQRLAQLGYHTYLLDGDNVRHGLNRDLGFSDADRVENIRRIGEVSKLFVDAGLLVLTAFISPFQSDRQLVRQLHDTGEFIEIFVDTPLAVCEQRDPKGLYLKARAGEIKHFTGIDSAYEVPLSAEIHLHTADMNIDRCVSAILQYLTDGGYLQPRG
ncbi:MAG: adenylylsulfate kinase [Shewanella sp.]|nr:adenylylsulfate kinase [Shewanella sp.]